MPCDGVVDIGTSTLPTYPSNSQPCFLQPRLVGSATDTDTGEAPFVVVRLSEETDVLVLGRSLWHPFNAHTDSTRVQHVDFGAQTDEMFSKEQFRAYYGALIPHWLIIVAN